MNSYELYKKVLEALNGDEGTFNAAARNWIESGKTPDFKNDEANNLYYTAKVACAAWRNKAINGRVSKGRMIECVRKIAQMKLDNPYDPNEKVEEPVQENIAEQPEEKKEEIVHVLGVVPENKEEPVKIAADNSTKQEETKEEKHFFGKRKNK